MATRDLIVELEHVSKSYGGVRALDDVTFECQEAEVHAVVGQNGAGKSTLMKILAGAVMPDSGEIVVGGERVTLHSPHDAQVAGISIIYQEFNLLPELNVAANVFLGREPRHAMGLLDRAELNKRAQVVLSRLGVEIDPTMRVGNLGVAEQQMVEIAKALSLDARIVIMDEPSAALGTRDLERLFAVIDALKNEGVAVIYISHRLQEVFEVADTVTIMRDGKRVDTKAIGDVTRSMLVEMMIGQRSFTEQFPSRSNTVGRELLRIDSLEVAGLLHNINLTVHSGEVVGLAGLIGSGRTELAEVIFGARGLTSGRIYLKGKEIHPGHPRRVINQGIGYLPESRKDDGLVMGLSVQQNVALASIHRRQRAGFVRKNQEKSAVEDVIKQLSIKTPSLGQEVERLSGGNQQKVAIAKWLLCSPRVLIFDEPTRGIDVQAKVEVWKLMRELAASGAAVLMISSELPEVIGMSDRILVMHKGSIAGELVGPEATEQQILTLASFGENIDSDNVATK